MEYKLCKFKILANKGKVRCIKLNYINPNCVFEESFNIDLLDDHMFEYVFNNIHDAVGFNQWWPASFISNAAHDLHTIHARVEQVPLPFKCVRTGSKMPITHVIVHCLLENIEGEWKYAIGYEPETLMLNMVYKSGLLKPFEESK